MSLKDELSADLRDGISKEICEIEKMLAKRETLIDAAGVEGFWTTVAIRIFHKCFMETVVEIYESNGQNEFSMGVSSGLIGFLPNNFLEEYAKTPQLRDIFVLPVAIPTVAVFLH